jgi:hypothetical protein
MAVDQVVNFAYSTVATSPIPDTTGLSLSVAEGTGSLFPTPPFNATAWPPNVQPLKSNAEIVRVTAVDGDTFTIERAQEDTDAQTITVGWQIAQNITKELIDQIEALVSGGGASYPFIVSGAGSPLGVVVPPSIGAAYYDTSGVTGWWFAATADESSWVAFAGLLATNPGLSSVSYMLSLVASSNAEVSLSDVNAMNDEGSFNQFNWYNNGTDGLQQVIWYLGYLAQYQWNFGPDGTSSFPGRLGLANSGSYFYAYPGAPAGNVIGGAGDFCFDSSTPEIWKATDGGSPATVTGSTITLPLTAVADVNDEFVYDGVTYTVAAGTYATLYQVAQALANASSESGAFINVSGLQISYPSGTTLTISQNPGWDSNSSGYAEDYNGTSITAGTNDVSGDLGLTGATLTGGVDTTWESATTGGGGSANSPITRAFSFAYDTADITTGAALYTPTPGDILLDAWVEIDTAWDGTTPTGDVGFFGADTNGLYYYATHPYTELIDMSSADIEEGADYVYAGFFQQRALSSAVISGGGVGDVPAYRRVVPGKFTTTDPIGIIVNQTGAVGGASSGSSVGAGVLYIITVTPLT